MSLEDDTFVGSSLSLYGLSIGLKYNVHWAFICSYLVVGRLHCAFAH